LPPPQANAVQAAAAQWAAVQEAATDQPYTAAEEAATGQLTWRQAYAAILREFASEFPSLSEGFDFFGSFLLLNTNDTGIPTLIVFATDAFGNFPRGAYAFSGGALSPIELGDMPGIFDFYMPPGDTGIVARGGGGDGMSFYWLELEADGFRQRVSGIFFSTGEHFVDGQEVSVDEFFRVFPHWSEWPDDRPRIRQITEENIQNVVLGGAWRQAYAAILRELAPEFINYWDNSPGLFFLYDINGTGTPNLIVFEDNPGFGFLTRRAYAFAGGALSPIELGDMPGHLTWFYMPPGDTGIVAISGGGDGISFYWLELEADGFRRRVSGWYFSSGEHFIDGQEVSVDEFFSVFPHTISAGRFNENFLRIWQMTEENIQNVVLGVEQPYTAAEEAAAAQLTWRQAYADLLRELAPEFTSQWGVSADFHLFDIDGTGTPNLLVTEWGAGGHSGLHSAYAFEDGALSQIELGDMQGLSVSSFYMPPGDTGIVGSWVVAGSQMFGFHWLELEDGTFRRRVSGRAEDGWDRTFYHIGGQEVSEDEFWSVFHRWSELPPDDRPPWGRGWEMTEGNIQNVILGGWGANLW